MSGLENKSDKKISNKKAAIYYPSHIRNQNNNRRLCIQKNVYIKPSVILDGYVLYVSIKRSIGKPMLPNYNLYFKYIIKVYIILNFPAQNKVKY